MAQANGLAKASCQTCRARHLDCDRIEPCCRRCKEAGRTCVPGFNVRFRRRRNPLAADAGLHLLPGKKSLTFDRDQAWVKTPKALSFVDETQDIVLGYEDQFSDVEESPPGANGHREGTPSSDPATDDALLSARSDGFNASTFPDASYGLTPIATITSPTAARVIDSAEFPSRDDIHSVRIEDLLNDSTIGVAPLLPDNELVLTRTPSIPPLYVDRRTASLITCKYAALLQHFKERIGWVWFDVTDYEFTLETLRLVPSCPVLLYAVLALSAMHKSRVADYDVNEAEEYHERCVSLLLPMLDDKRIITDGAFLATSTLLRFYEEVSAPVHGRDDARHLLGGYASVAAAQEERLPWTGLRNAALWVHQRQDVFNAILNQRRPKTDLDKISLDRSMTAADECIWAKRASCLTADVVEWCFGPEAGSVPKYLTLTQKLRDWDVYKPIEYTPVYFSDSDPSIGKYFPDYCLTLDACFVGLAYWHLAMLLLAVYDPTLPKIGPKYLEGRERTREKVLYHIRLLCGLTYSNPAPPGRVVATLAISQCGVWVTDAVEQEELLKVLRHAEQEDAWPGGEAERIVTEQWKQSVR